MVSKTKFEVIGTEYTNWIVDVMMFDGQPIKASTVSTLSRDTNQRHYEFGQPRLAAGWYHFGGKNTHDSFCVTEDFTKIIYKPVGRSWICGELVEA